MKNIRILLACVCGNRLVDIDSVRSFLSIALAFQQAKVEFDFLGLSGIPHLEHARNAVVSHFLTSRFTHLLCLDSDMEVQPKTVQRLLNFSETYNQPFVAAPYVTKGYPNEKTSRVYARDLDDFHASVVNWNVVFEDEGILNGKVPLKDTKNGFAKAVRVGAGAMLCRRDMLERMVMRYKNEAYTYHNTPYKLYPLFNIPVVEGRAIGEDYAFCDRWREMGGELWVDTTASIQHIGHHSFHGNLQESLSLLRKAQERHEMAGNG